MVLTTSAILVAQISVDVRLVNVIATVTDDRGRYVGNLTADDFIIEEDGRPQKISHFSQDNDVPISVGVLLDTSGSMERKLRTAVDAVDRFVDRIHKDDEIFLMTFANEPVLRQDFTSDRNKLFHSMHKTLPTGGTALYDALSEGLVKIRSGIHDKRAILLITDGQDTSSLTTLDQVLRTIRESELLVYCLGISPLPRAQRADRRSSTWKFPPIFSRKSNSSARRDDVDMNVLRAFADGSGGGAFLLSEGLVGGPSTQMERILDKVAEELRSQYTLGYYPAHADDSQYHSIRIRTKKGNVVRARKGYIARAS
jgi:VWFA-related protein